MGAKTHHETSLPQNADQIYRITCGCGARLKVKAKAIGRKLPCPQCKQLIEIRLDMLTGNPTANAERQPSASDGKTSGTLPPSPAKKQQVPRSSPVVNDSHEPHADHRGTRQSDTPSPPVDEGKSRRTPSPHRLPPTIQKDGRGDDGARWRAPVEPSPQAPATKPEAEPGANPDIRPTDQPTDDGDSRESDAIAPWETHPELLEKAQRYEENQQGVAFLCKCNEFLNGISKKETMRDAVLESELRVYEDMVVVDGRLGWLPAWINQVTAAIGVGVFLVLVPLRVLSMAYNLMGIIGFLMWLMIMALAPVVLWEVIIHYWLFSLIAVVIMGAGIYAANIWSAKRLGDVLRRIRQDPHSPFAIRKLFKYTPLIPRIWERGDVVQLVRLDTRHRLRKRSLLLLVQDNPFPLRSFWSSGAGVNIGRWYRGDRRVYVVSFDAGPDAADEAAEATSHLFGVPISQATFSGGLLRMAK